MRYLFLLILAIPMLFACSFEVKKPPVYVSKEKGVMVKDRDGEMDVAKHAVENFHSLFNDGKYAEMFQLIDEKSELKQDPVYFDRRMSIINNELGKFETTTFTRGSVFQKSSTYEVRLEFISKFSFEKTEKPRYELFYWEVYPDGKINLLEYKNGIDNEKGY